MTRTRIGGFARAAAVAAVATALAVPVPGAGQEPAGVATLAELRDLFAAMRAEGASNVDGPLHWRYSFGATDQRRLEALSLDLVEAGYGIVTLGASGSGDGLVLVVQRVEHHTPSTLHRRGEELGRLAAAHGAAYRGVDVGPARWSHPHREPNAR